MDTIWLDDASSMWELSGHMDGMPPRLFGMTEEASEGAQAGYTWYTTGDEGTGVYSHLRLKRPLLLQLLSTV